MEKNNLNLKEILELAVQNHKQQKFLEAKNLYKQAIKVDSKNYLAYNNLGTIYIYLKKLEIAKTYFEKAIQLKPNYNDAKKNFNVVIEKLKIRDNVKKNWESHINQTPKKTSFILDEFKNRGFFLDNNINQIKKGDEQLPLLTWPLLDFLKTIDLQNVNLFELGSGNSTIWFSNIFNHIQSFETDKNWYENLKPKLKSNVTYKLISLEKIYDCNFEFKTENWLLIDFAGKRTKFVKKLVESKNENLPAQIIFDNSEWYRNSAKLLSEKGYTEIPFYGFKSGEINISCSSIFLLKDYSKLKILPSFFYPSNSNKINNNWDSFD